LKVRVNEPAGDVLVELGSSDFLKRYKTYVSHVQEWRQQFQKLESVNLRYDNQVIVNPEMEGKPRQPALSVSAARAAAAAGVKPAALLTRLGPHDRTLPKPAFELTQKRLDSVSPKQSAPKPRVRRTRAGSAEAAKKMVAKGAGPRQKRVATTTHLAAHKTETKRQAAPAVAVHPAIPKPSAAIAKQQANTGSD